MLRPLAVGICRHFDPRLPSQTFLIFAGMCSLYWIAAVPRPAFAFVGARATSRCHVQVSTGSVGMCGLYGIATAHGYPSGPQASVSLLGADVLLAFREHVWSVWDRHCSRVSFYHFLRTD